MKKRVVILFLGLSLFAAGCGGNISSKTEQSGTSQSQAAQDSDELEQTEMQAPVDEAQAEPSEEVQENDTVPEVNTDSESVPDAADGGSTPEQQTEQSEPVEEAETGETNENEGEAFTPVEGQTDVMQEILTAMPGTAGSSLKTVSAAVNLLDWSRGTASSVSGEQIAAGAKEWASQQIANGIAKEELIQALDTVQAKAVLIQTDPEGVAGELEDAGVELHGDYSAVDISGVCTALREGIQAA